MPDEPVVMSLEEFLEMLEERGLACDLLRAPVDPEHPNRLIVRRFWSWKQGPASDRKESTDDN